MISGKKDQLLCITMKLVIVPTPIGNLEDMTFRAINVLKKVDVILAEDTRTSAKLMKHYKIKTPMQAFHMHNEHKILDRVIERLEQGDQIALVSDAGTPGISDPGFLLVRECTAKNIQVETLPGPTAFVPALVNSGLPTDRFTFEGFLPQKKGRQTKLQQLSTEPRTMIFYESPYRLVKTLTQMSEHFGLDRTACVSRELSKIYEENKRGSLQDLAEHYKMNGVKGEIVLVVQGHK